MDSNGLINKVGTFKLIELDDCNTLIKNEDNFAVASSTRRNAKTSYRGQRYPKLAEEDPTRTEVGSDCAQLPRPSDLKLQPLMELEEEVVRKSMETELGY